MSRVTRPKFQVEPRHDLPRSDVYTSKTRQTPTTQLSVFIPTTSLTDAYCLECNRSKISQTFLDTSCFFIMVACFHEIFFNGARGDKREAERTFQEPVFWECPLGC